MPAYMAVGATAGLKRYLAEQNLPQTIEGASRILAEDSCLNAGDPITALILKNYRLLLDGVYVTIASVDSGCSKM